MFGKTSRNKIYRISQSIVIHIRVICQYSIVINRNAFHFCACAGLILYCAEMSIMQEFRKTLKMFNILYPGFTCDI